MQERKSAKGREIIVICAESNGAENRLNVEGLPENRSGIITFPDGEIPYLSERYWPIY
jgi:hypothetical protein